MKRLRIKTYEIGLLIRNQEYVRVLRSGVHWIRFGDQVLRYDLGKEFGPQVNLQILLKDEILLEMLHVLQVENNHLVVVKENGLYKHVLTAGQYAFWKGYIAYEFKHFDLDDLVNTQEIASMCQAMPELSKYVTVFVIDKHEEGLLFLDGVLVKKLVPGIHHYWRGTRVLTMLKADMRLSQLEINGQEILTSDKVNLRLNLIAHYRISDIQRTLVQTREYEKQLYTQVQIAYRESITSMRFDEILAQRNQIEEQVQVMIRSKMEILGIDVEWTGIKDIILPGEVKEMMQQVLVAEKKAQANLVTRREETAAMRSLLNTAKLLEENPMLYKLKEMDSIERIAERINQISISNDQQTLAQLKQLFAVHK